MKYKQVFGHLSRAAIFFWVVLSLINPPTTGAQLNITNYGGTGDLLILTNFNTVSNSAIITATFATFGAGDVGKVIEVENAGVYHPISNAWETLVGTIQTYNNPTSIVCSVKAANTSNGNYGYFGANNWAAFSNAVAHAAVPTDTILIPPGTYLVVNPGIVNSNASISINQYAGIKLTRGGISFLGQGTGATLFNSGGFYNIGNQVARGSLVQFYSVTNDCPVVFSNLTFDGGVRVGNQKNSGYPANPSTGDGWDTWHHAIQTYSGAQPSAIWLLKDTFQHWRGEVVIDTASQPNVVLYATNSIWMDGDASFINNFAHKFDSCTFSNAKMMEEFYRTWATNSSMDVNCTFDYLNFGIVLNGGYYGNPPYTVIGCTFTNFYGQFAVITTPADDFFFYSNTVYGGAYKTSAIATGAAGYQSIAWQNNSNIVCAYNYLTNSGECFDVLGGQGTNATINFYVFSNTLVNCHYVFGGYGWGTNIYFLNNNCINSGHPSFGSLSGQYPLDQSNNYAPYTRGSYSKMDYTNILSYATGSQVIIPNLGGVITYTALSTNDAALIPLGAQMFVKNNYGSALQIYRDTSIVGNPVVISNGESQVFYWNKVKGGYAWMTNKITPPPNLRASY